MKRQRAISQYPGGKWELRDWIVSQFPKPACYDAYVESFVGLGSVFFAKPPSPVEILNDRDEFIIAFWKTLADRPQDLIRQVALTPYSRLLHTKAIWARHNGFPKLTEFGKALAFLVSTRQSRNGSVFGGWSQVVGHSRRGMASSVSRWLNLPEDLLQFVDRIKVAQLECRPAIHCMAAYDRKKTLHYIDPPYHPSTRKTKHLYQFEMNAEDHDYLLDAVNSLQGWVFLSGYRCPIYDKALKHWERRDFKIPHRTNSSSKMQTRSHNVESLWIKKPSGK